jgi:hypothetical protein
MNWILVSFQASAGQQHQLTPFPLVSSRKMSAATLVIVNSYYSHTLQEYFFKLLLLFLLFLLFLWIVIF